MPNREQIAAKITNPNEAPQIERIKNPAGETLKDMIFIKGGKFKMEATTNASRSSGSRGDDFAVLDG